MIKERQLEDIELPSKRGVVIKVDIGDYNTGLQKMHRYRFFWDGIH
jgi:hypothetical protein